MTLAWGSIRLAEAQQNLAEALKPLIGMEITNLKIPVAAAAEFEPSQIGTIVGTLVDAMLPHLADELQVGLSKNPSILGSREGYPDYAHTSGYRLELKGLFKDNLDVRLKKPPTPREPSARLTQKVTLNNVRPDDDALLIIAYHLAPTQADNSLLSPIIVDLLVIPVIECVMARDHRLTARGGKWFGDYETPGVLSKAGKRKIKAGLPLNTDVYGRKESEGHDFNEDTNFGKLKRIPYKPIQEFLKKHGAAFAASGTYPTPWRIVSDGSDEYLVELDEDDD